LLRHGKYYLAKTYRALRKTNTFGSERYILHTLLDNMTATSLLVLLEFISVYWLTFVNFIIIIIIIIISILNL
jgi:hypothetical protein